MAVTETPPETVAAAEPPDPAAPRPEPTGLAAVLGSGDHKVVGRLYVVTALLFGVAAVVLGGLFAFEATEVATLEVFAAESVFQFFTLYRLGTVFLVAFPLVIGVAMVVVPLQVGASTVAFPRAAAASYWAWLVASGLFVASYLMDGGPGGSSSSGVNLWLASLGLLVVAVVMAATCLATTVFALRTPGLSLTRAPLYAWSVAVASVLWILTLPVLFAAVVVSYVDHRHAGGVLGGNASLYPRTLWVLRNPQIYVVAIPVLGFVADVLATTAQARLSMRGAARTAIAGAGVVAFGAVLATPDPAAYDSPVLIAMGLAAVLPILAIGGLLADLFRRGSFRLTAGAVYAVCATLLLLLATAAGALGSIPALETAGTIYDLGVNHAAVLAAVTASLGGVHWWATKVGRQPANEGLGRLAPVVLLLGGVLVSVPDLVSGLTGEGLELSADWTGGIEGLNIVVLAGSVVVAAGLALALVSLLPLLKAADQVERDPWGGQTLEWLAPSPPPLANFDADLPVVTSAEPLVDLREEK
jgi:cytochrome c oxidase subunit 1